MTLTKQLRAYVWDCIPPTISWLIEARNSFGVGTPEVARAGINYSIILNSACYVEGALAVGLKGILNKKHYMYHDLDKKDFDTRRTLNLFFNNLYSDLYEHVGKTTGAENYNRVFELIVDTPLNELDGVKQIWEGVCVLFHFRNMLAHGRGVEIDYTLTHWEENNEVWTEEFTGGYSKVEEYLLKNSLIDKKFGEQESAWYFFGDSTADHFWKLAQDFITGISKSLSGVDQTAFDSALNPKLSEEIVR